MLGDEYHDPSIALDLHAFCRLGPHKDEAVDIRESSKILVKLDQLGVQQLQSLFDGFRLSVDHHHVLLIVLRGENLDANVHVDLEQQAQMALPQISDELDGRLDFRTGLSSFRTVEIGSVYHFQLVPYDFDSLVERFWFRRRHQDGP